MKKLGLLLAAVVGCGGDPFALADAGGVAPAVVVVTLPAVDAGAVRPCNRDCAVLGCGLHGDPCGGTTINCGECASAARVPDIGIGLDASAYAPVDASIDAGAGLDASASTALEAAEPDVGRVVCIPGVGCCGPLGLFGCYMPPNTTDRVLACCNGYGLQPNVGGYCGPLLDSGACTP